MLLFLIILVDGDVVFILFRFGVIGMFLFIIIGLFVGCVMNFVVK